MVCSGLEAKAVFKAFPHTFIATPGIRFAESGVQDQKRVVTPGMAIRNGSSLVVMGTELMKGGAVAAERALKEIVAALQERGQ